MFADRTPHDSARDWRESLQWIILASLGTLIPLGFGFICKGHLAGGTLIYNPTQFIGLSIVLTVSIPFAVKANHQLGLPGGPLIIATLNREPRPYPWREVFLGGVLWSVIFFLLSLIAVFIGAGLLLYFFPWFIPHFLRHRVSGAPIVKRSETWLVSSIVISAVSAGVQEEILFRFVLMGVFSRALMTIGGRVDQPPSRKQLWLANTMQAYCFGVAHLLPDIHLTTGIVGLGEVAIRSLVQPQTFTGVFLGWLYLRSGLETSMVSHIFFDLL